MTDGRKNTVKRPEPDEIRVVTLEIDIEVPVWHDEGFDGEPIASVCSPADTDHPWKIRTESVSAALIEDLQQEFSADLQEKAAKERADRDDDHRRFRGMSEDEYMERIRERKET